MRTKASIPSVGPLQRELGKLCRHLHAVCFSSGWAARLQKRADGADCILPLCLEREGRETNGGVSCGGECWGALPRPGAEAPNPTSRRVFSIHPHPGTYTHLERALGCRYTNLHDNPHTGVTGVASTMTTCPFNFNFRYMITHF